MPFRFSRPVAFAVLASCLTVAPALAEEGFLDRLFGGTPSAAPANPFASNYPSAPPARRDFEAARAERAARRSRDVEAGPVPPGRIPAE